MFLHRIFSFFIIKSQEQYALLRFEWIKIKLCDEIPMLLIDCDLFHLLFFNLFSLKQLFRNVLQNFAKATGCKLSRKDFVKGPFLWNLGKFSEQLLARTTFGECFCFRGWPCAALSKQEIFDMVHWTNNAPYNFSELFLQISFPENKKSKHSAIICHWWSTVLAKSQVKFAEAGFHIFLEHIRFWQNIYFVEHMQVSSNDL